MRRSGIIVGIDPDVSKSGIAVLDCSKQTFTQVDCLSFAQMVNKFVDLAADMTSESVVTIVMEDSDISCNWHTSPRDNKAVAAAKGRSVGMCHATARHLKEVAENFGLEVVGHRPLIKIWHGKDKKISHDEAIQFMRGLPTRTNQEMRDAALLAWSYADIPIWMKV